MIFNQLLHCIIFQVEVQADVSKQSQLLASSQADNLLLMIFCKMLN